AGGKGANLGELISAGFPVPPGFVITAPAFLWAMDQGGVRTLLADSVARAAGAPPEEVEQIATSARDAIRAAGVPAEIADDIRAAYRSLEAELGVDRLAVAVRS